MGRSRGGGGRSRGSGGKRSSFFSTPAKQTQSPPPMTQQPQRQGGGFFSTMAQGFALGTGSAVAHEAIHGAVRSFSGGSGEGQAEQVPPQQQFSSGAEVCAGQQKAFLDCMQANNGNMGMCQYYFEAMQSCKLSNPTM